MNIFALLRSVLYPLVFMYCADLVWRAQIVSTGRGKDDFLIMIGNYFFAMILFLITIIVFLFSLKKAKGDKTNPFPKILEITFLVAGLIIAHFYYNASYNRFYTNLRICGEFSVLDWMDVTDSAKAFYPVQLKTIQYYEQKELNGRYQPFFKFEDWMTIGDNVKFEAAKLWITDYELWLKDSGARYRKTPLSETEINDMAIGVLQCLHDMYDKESFDSDWSQKWPSNAYNRTAICIQEQYSQIIPETRLYFSSIPYFVYSTVRNRPWRLL